LLLPAPALSAAAAAVVVLVLVLCCCGGSGPWWLVHRRLTRRLDSVVALWQEYLLVYNYQAYGVDSAPPDTGIIVQHIDESILADPVNSVRGYPSQSCWPWNGKHYKVAILAADGQYKLETVTSSSYGKGGDANTAYVKSSVFKISDSTVPSTNQYHYGYGVKSTGITITVKSDSASCMQVSAV
jgi:hypothetical protein